MAQCPWTGSYFDGIPITLEAVANPGYRFVGWSDAALPLEPLVEVTLSGDYSVSAAFEPAFTPAAAATLDWAFQTGSAIRSSPAIGPDGTVYVGSDDHNLYAIRPDGTRKWAFVTGDDVHSSPAISDDGKTVYVGSRDGRLYAVAAADGTQRWHFEDVAMPLGNVDATPSIGHDGAVYFGAENGIFYAVNPDGTERWRFVQPMVNIQTQAAIRGDGAVIFGCDDGWLYAVKDGVELWRFDAGSQLRSTAALDRSGHAYFGTYNGTVFCLNTNPTPPTVAWSVETGWVGSSPMLGPDGTIYVGTRTCTFCALNPADGSVKWSYSTGGDVDSTAAISDNGRVYVSSSDGLLYAFEANPADPQNVVPAWTFAFGGGEPASESSPAIGPDGRLYVGSNNGCLFAVRPGSSPLAASDWPMYGADVRHTGRGLVIGDVNGDGCVNVADLLMVRNNLGKSGSGITLRGADVNRDAIVNVADLLTVRNHIGAGLCQ
jgi:outer membrane protein assembly factor BamB